MAYRGSTIFARKVQNFPEEVYALRETDHLTKMLKVLLGDVGTGQLSKVQTLARLSEAFGGTQFSDLDFFYGTFLRFKRLPEESYDYNPFDDQLTWDQWDEVYTRDGSYRERIRLFLSALSRGGTPEGMAMAAEAACGYPCQIFEVWRYIDDLGVTTNTGRASPETPREFVIVPKTDNLSASRKYAIHRALDRLKPMSSMITVDPSGLPLHTEIPIRSVSASSEYQEVEKWITDAPEPIVIPPDTNPSWNFYFGVGEYTWYNGVKYGTFDEGYRDAWGAALDDLADQGYTF